MFMYWLFKIIKHVYFCIAETCLFSVFPAHVNISYNTDNVHFMCRKRGGLKTVVVTTYYQARTQGGGVRWVRTNPPLRSQLQNDSAPFLNKLSINNREFGYTVKMRLFCYVKHII